MKQFSEFLSEIHRNKEQQRQKQVLLEHLCNGDLVGFIVACRESYVLDNLLQESRWQTSGIGDLMYRIDPARPELHQLRHVAVAHRKHTKSGPMVSWNDDHSRHDAHKFPKKVTEPMRQVARQALNLPNDAILEVVEIIYGGDIRLLLESF